MSDIKPMTKEEIEKLRKVCRLGIGISGHKGSRLIATIDALKAQRDQARREALEEAAKYFEGHGCSSGWYRSNIVANIRALAAKEKA